MAIHTGSAGPTQLDVNVVYNGPGSSLQRFVLGLPPGGYTASNIIAGLPGGSTSQTVCAPITSATAGNEIQCNLPSATVVQGQTLSLNFTIAPALPSGAAFIYQAQDSTGTTVGTAPGPTGAPTVTPASDCHCAQLRLALQDFKVEAQSVVFSFVWEMTCVAGTSGECRGKIDVLDPHRVAGLEWAASVGKGLTAGVKLAYQIHCVGSCRSATSFGSHKFELLGSAHARAGKTLFVSARYSCNDLPTPLRGHETFALHFDSDGKLDRRKSRLG